MAFGITARGILDKIRERVSGPPVVDVVSNNPRVQASARAKATLPQAQRLIGQARRAQPTLRNKTLDIGQAIQRFQAPVAGKVRFRDVLREVPEAAGEVLVREPLTEAVRLGRGIQDIGRKEKRGVQLPTQLHGLFSKEAEQAGEIAPVSELKRTTVPTEFLKAKGFSDRSSKAIGTFAGFGLTALFADPRLGAGKTGKNLGKVVELIGQTDDLADIAKALKTIKLTKKEIAAVAPQLRGVSDADEIANIIKKGVTPGGKVKVKTTRSLADEVEQFDPKIKVKETSELRRFSESVQEAPNISDKTKAFLPPKQFTPKPNTELMGEARALLVEGGKIDFRGVKNVDKKVAATMQEAINLDAGGNPVPAAALLNNLAEQATELGRGVQAFAMLNKMSPEAIALSAAGRIQKWNRTAFKKIPELTGEQLKLISDTVEHIHTLPVGRNRNIAIKQMGDLVDSFIPTNLSTKIMTVWKAGLLTSLRTHERNIVGNVIMGASEVAKDIPAMLADKSLSLVTGKRSMAFTTRGLGEGATKETGQQIADMITKGFDPTDSINKFDYKKVNWGNKWHGKVLKGYTEAIFRSLGAGDKPFFNSAFGRSLYDQATTTAINAGRRGDSAFIKDLVENAPQEMLDIAFKEASSATFKDKNILTTISSGIKRIAADPNSYKRFGADDINSKAASEIGEMVTEMLMPFTGVPSSIVGKTLAYSPIGLVQGVTHAGRVVIAPKSVPGLQRQASQEIGRGVMGTGLMAIGAYLVSKGLMTGMPEGTKEWDQLKLEGKGPNSVLVGGKWRSINSVGPQTLVVLAGAKALEELQDDEKTLGGKLGSLAAGLAKDQLEQTFLAGVQKPLKAIQEPDRFGTSFVGGQASSVVPNIVKDVSKAFDPQGREFNTVGDHLKGAVPGLRNTLIPKRDVLGKAVPQTPTGIAAFFDLFNSKTPISNTVVDEITRLSEAGESVTPGKVPKSQTVLGEKRKLEPGELDKLEEKAGERATTALAQLIESPDYARLTDEEKTKLIKDTVSDSRKSAKLDIASEDLGGTQVKGFIEAKGPLDVIRTIQDGKEVQVDIGKVAAMPSGSEFEKAKKEDAAWSAANKIFKTSISDEEKASIYDKLGIEADDIEYFSVAKESTDLKGAAIADVIAENPDADIVDVLAPYRKDVNGSKILSNGVIDDLFKAGTITKEQKKLLKSITGIDADGQAIQAAGTGKKAKKVKFAAPRAIRTKAVSTQRAASKRRRGGRGSAGASVSLPAAKRGARAKAATAPTGTGPRVKPIRRAQIKALSTDLKKVTGIRAR